jgi:glycosyltransferase involved in cell wall biosynthesis
VTIEVSVVVPTFNRPQLLERCLEGLVAQAFDPTAYEVVIADDAASDSTRRQVEAWRSRFLQSGPAIHYLPVRDTRGPAAARNAGWQFARGRVIAGVRDGSVIAVGARARVRSREQCCSASSCSSTSATTCGWR